jgi:hypothetical protein
MRTRQRDVFLGWPSWRYGPDGEAAIFQKEEDVPLGWKPKVQLPFVPRSPSRFDREELIKLLDEKGIHIDSTWSTARMKEALK